MANELCKVLVVEDEHDNADSAVMLLQLWGHEAVAAYSGRQAISMARACDPDVVLIDVAMPEMDGFDVAKQLKELCPDAKLVAFTGFTQADIVRRLRAAGFVDVVAKAVSPATLKEAVDTQCAARDDPCTNGDR